MPDELAIRLHEWYLEATAKLNPESFNPNAQKPYDDLTDEQKFIDTYIAGKVKSYFLSQALDLIGADDPIHTYALRDRMRTTRNDLRAELRAAFQAKYGGSDG